jgi:hypothetical protein
MSLWPYAYALVGVILFVGSAVGVGVDFADFIANGSSLYIGTAIIAWIVALLTTTYTHSHVAKHISAGLFAILSGLTAGILARRFDYVGVVQRSAVISSVFSITAASILLISGSPCISGWALLGCAGSAVAVAELLADAGYLTTNVIDTTRTNIEELVKGNILTEQTVSSVFLVGLFVYLLELSKRICERSESTDYVGTVMAPYTGTVRLLERIVRAGC